MKCPFCGEEMQHGAICGDGRSRVSWEAEGEKIGFFDKLAGVGLIDAKYTWGWFRIEADYCQQCHKMIFDTVIGK